MFLRLSAALEGLFPLLKVIQLQGLLISDYKALTPPNPGPTAEEQRQFDDGGNHDPMPRFLVYVGSSLKVSVPLKYST